MLKSLFMIVWVAILTPTLRADDNKDKPNLHSIEGHWAVTEASADGKRVELPHNWIFKANGKANLIDRKLGTQSLFRFKLDDTVTPYRIELTYFGPDDRLKGHRQIGIWKLDGDQLTMLLQQPSTAQKLKSDQYPSDFNKPSGKEMLLMLERQILSVKD